MIRYVCHQHAIVDCKKSDRNESLLIMNKIKKSPLFWRLNQWSTAGAKPFAKMQTEHHESRLWPSVYTEIKAAGILGPVTSQQASKLLQGSPQLGLMSRLRREHLSGLGHFGWNYDDTLMLDPLKKLFNVLFVCFLAVYCKRIHSCCMHNKTSFGKKYFTIWTLCHLVG